MIKRRTKHTTKSLRKLKGKLSPSLTSTLRPARTLSSDQLRRRFLEYFEEQAHTIVASSPLVPANDPTLLFTNAGMVQFKDVFLGKEKRSYVRAASSQRCVRAGGKHNDLENVGYTARHHTFFEMLGNFSFGDYFKREAIRFAWEFVTGKDWLGIDPKRLMVTVYHTDDEAFDAWHREVRLAKDRIVRIGDRPEGGSDNFWQMGETGPCGPCSEIFYDHGVGIPGGPPGSPDAEGDRWVEIWNLVFMQFDRAADGTLTPLPKPSVDTGMGLERVAAVMQGVHSNYEIDLFQGLIKATAEIAGTKDLNSSSLRAIADHIRACSFLIVDGVLPSNEGRGYVLRRIIRRAIRHGYKLDIHRPFFYKLVAALEQSMGSAYPELRENRGLVERVILQEEQRFASTLEVGMMHLQLQTSLAVTIARYLAGQGATITGTHTVNGSGRLDLRYTSKDGKRIAAFVRTHVPTRQEIFDLHEAFSKFQNLGKEFDVLKIFVVLPSDESVPANLATWVSGLETEVDIEVVGDEAIKPYKVISGETAFVLYDRYGFPLDFTADYAREVAFEVDTAGFNRAMEAQRNRARAASKFSVDLREGVSVEGRTDFSGYDGVTDRGRVVELIKTGAKTESLRAGEEGQVVLDRSPFYAEAGGQVGDKGVLTAPGVRFEVIDTQKVGGVHAHIGKLAQGELKLGDTVEAQVDADLRRATMLNHTATHLLHAALRKVLGTHVVQKGSLVAPDRLRFDFSHHQAVTPSELKQIEQLVNSQVRANEQAQINVMKLEEAKASGAIALFGEKYDDDVRVLRIGDFSMELCGGTHVTRTGEIGFFKILGETGVAAGTRRIEAVTGEGALQWAESTDELVRSIESLVNGSRKDVRTKIEQLVARLKTIEKELQQLKLKLVSSAKVEGTRQEHVINGTRVVIQKHWDADVATLRQFADREKSLGTPVYIATSKDKNEKTLFVVSSGTPAVKASDLAAFMGETLGGRGGGRADFAQGGGPAPQGVDPALKHVELWLHEMLKKG